MSDTGNPPVLGYCHYCNQLVYLGLIHACSTAPSNTLPPVGVKRDIAVPKETPWAT